MLGTVSSGTSCGGAAQPPGEICPSGVTVPATYAVVNGQCVLEYNCPIVTGCQQGASCTPGSGSCGYGAAGCGTTCVCYSTGIYENCTNDCNTSGGHMVAPDAGSSDDASTTGEAGVTGDASADALIDVVVSL